MPPPFEEGLESLVVGGSGLLSPGEEESVEASGVSSGDMSGDCAWMRSVSCSCRMAAWRATDAWSKLPSAGMGGLVLGLCLKKYAPDVHFDIYESASELTEVGAGIGMTHRIWSIMEELGIQDELVAITGTHDRNGVSFSTSFAYPFLICSAQGFL